MSRAKISCIYDTPCDPKSEQFCPKNELSEPPKTRCDRLKTGSSCQALRHAVQSLYRLDDFHKEKIGSGFFSEVFKVIHRVTGEVMALKLNLLHSNRRNMLKEAQLMNKLHHPNILSLMGVCVNEGQLHALTEYIDGGSLEQLIQDLSVDLPQKTRVSLALDIAKGMSYLHSKNIFHRDLTSKNVLVKRLESGELRAIVGDFGLASSIPDETTQLCTVGSPYWMSPECLNGQHYDQRSDVFSYGIILCEMIARVEADPDQLPRTSNFGLDYLAFTELCGPNVVPEFVNLAFRCCTIEPKSRPSFDEIVRLLNVIYKDLKAAEEVEVAKLASCAARSEEQLPIASIQTSLGDQQFVRRRSLSEDVLSLSLYITPGDKARRHALTMCRQDPHYVPRTSNPFAALPQFSGVKKFVGNLASSSYGCTESKCITKECDNTELPKSLPGSPTAPRKTSMKKSFISHSSFKGGSTTNLLELNAAEQNISNGLRRRGSCESGFYSSVGECLSPNSLWDSGTAVSSLRSLDELEQADLFVLRKRASSIYTDSSEDISSLTSTEDHQKPRNISSIVDYFERKGTTFRHAAGSRGGLQLSSRIAALRRSLEKQTKLNSGTNALQLPNQRTQNTTRLVVCDGAVKSKLPLFDKKVL